MKGGQVTLTNRITAYEFMLFIQGLIATLFIIYTANLLPRMDDPALFSIFMTSLAFLVMLFLGWIIYNQTGEEINYTNIDKKNLLPSLLIILGSWLFGYIYGLNLYVSVYEASMASAIDAIKLAQILKDLAPLYLVLYAFVENLFFVVAIPSAIIKFVFKRNSIKEATFGEKLFASIVAGIVAVLAHIAWKGPAALVTTFVYFTSWALATLLIRNSIFADMVHSIGNALGWLYITIYPTYLL